MGIGTFLILFEEEGLVLFWRWWLLGSPQPSLGGERPVCARVCDPVAAAEQVLRPRLKSGATLEWVSANIEIVSVWSWYIHNFDICEGSIGQWCQAQSEEGLQ